MTIITLNATEPAESLIAWIESLLKRELTGDECAVLGVHVAALVTAYEPVVIAKARAEDAAHRNN